MMRKSPLVIIAAAIATIAVVVASKYFLTAAKCENQIVTLSLPQIKLPYKTEDGRALSMDGIPRGRFKISADNEITQIELSAVMLDPSQNLIKQVLMIGGNFPDVAEFELSDRFSRKIIRPAKVIDRIVVQPSGSNTNFIYLFAPPEVTRWNGSRIVSIELDNTIPIDHLSVRRTSTQSKKWVEGVFVRTNEQIKLGYARKNETKEYKATYVYGVSDACPKE
ncbi:MAG: hypothetical protein V7K32_04170 [Nostoc sp.]|uniref:hypothetical protein n=1 Tax=Nostoc sp. TaxID=1180 RepID=UPI002FFAF63C